MAGLQRSRETFRRSGSSGLVWDDRHLSGEIKPAGGDGTAAAAARVERSRSSGHGGGYRAAGRVQPALDPPSPRVAVCGFCRFFGGKGGSAGAAGKAKARRH
ncbi:MAPK kinase substrate protein At1g80180-like [Oryza brachyantha]|uniref:MAPK kinase substrate protein At1g80180-like n=1 Tax=Oryza brachyantha TaxID=4533 RepID=UPI001ADD031C|nr:MAPK kinase substrate protein At1g80180-like [Oryza brachyantha]